MQRLDDGQRGAAFDSGQTARIADRHSSNRAALDQRLDEVGAPITHRNRCGQFFVSDELRLCEHGVISLINDSVHPVDLSCQVHRSRSGLAYVTDQVVEPDSVDLGISLGVGNCNPECPGNTDCWSSSNGETLDCIDQRRHVTNIEPHEILRQSGLIDQPDATIYPINRSQYNSVSLASGTAGNLSDNLILLIEREPGQSSRPGNRKVEATLDEVGLCMKNTPAGVVHLNLVEQQIQRCLVDLTPTDVRTGGDMKTGMSNDDLYPTAFEEIEY